MAKPKADESDQSADLNARLVVSNEDKAKAKKWFARALELGGKRQFDYAIEYYVNGLEYWPDAVEEACKPLHGCAVARRQTGGKKPGLKDTMKRSLNDKDPKQAFLNAAWLFGHDPDNVDYIEGLVRNASRLRAEDSAKWAGGVCLKALEGMAKATNKQFQSLARLLEEVADRAKARGEVAFGVEVYQMGVQSLSLWRRRAPRDRNAENALRDLSTKLTILKGKYQESESFRDSIADREAQEEIHDFDRTVQADDRMEELISNAEKEYREQPDDARVLSNLINLLCRREAEKDELRAIGILVDRYKQTEDYRHKHMADDIRMKQLGRKLREARKAGDETALKEAQVASLRFDLQVFKERVSRYPTDNRVKFEYGARLFKAGRFDEAIPIFQNARADPKNRTACGMYLGRCFYRKGFYPQAISELRQEIAEYQFSDDELAKTMLYWLGRAEEDSGDTAAAKNTYGKILQVDYNYGDVRARLEGLAQAG